MVDSVDSVTRPPPPPCHNPTYELKKAPSCFFNSRGMSPWVDRGGGGVPGTPSFRNRILGWRAQNSISVIHRNCSPTKPSPLTPTAGGSWTPQGPTGPKNQKTGLVFGTGLIFEFPIYLNKGLMAQPHVHAICVCVFGSSFQTIKKQKY